MAITAAAWPTTVAAAAEAATAAATGRFCGRQKGRHQSLVLKFTTLEIAWPLTESLCFTPNNHNSCCGGHVHV